MHETVPGAHLVDAGNELPDPLPHGRPLVDVVQLGHPSALAPVDRHIEAMALEERVGQGVVWCGDVAW